MLLAVCVPCVPYVYLLSASGVDIAFALCSPLILSQLALHVYVVYGALAVASALATLSNPLHTRSPLQAPRSQQIICDEQVSPSDSILPREPLKSSITILFSVPVTMFEIFMCLRRINRPISLSRAFWRLSRSLIPTPSLALIFFAATGVPWYVYFVPSPSAHVSTPLFQRMPTLPFLKPLRLTMRDETETQSPAPKQTHTQRKDMALNTNYGLWRARRQWVLRCAHTSDPGSTDYYERPIKITPTPS